jgi:hypothetical protein
VVEICAATLQKKIRSLATLYIYMSHVMLQINSHYVHTQSSLTAVCEGSTVRSPRGTK